MCAFHFTLLALFLSLSLLCFFPLLVCEKRAHTGTVPGARSRKEPINQWRGGELKRIFGSDSEGVQGEEEEERERREDGELKQKDDEEGRRRGKKWPQEEREREKERQGQTESKDTLSSLSPTLCSVLLSVLLSSVCLSLSVCFSTLTPCATRAAAAIARKTRGNQTAIPSFPAPLSLPL